MATASQKTRRRKETGVNWNGTHFTWGQVADLKDKLDQIPAAQWAEQFFASHGLIVSVMRNVGGTHTQIKTNDGHVYYIDNRLLGRHSGRGWMQFSDVGSGASGGRTSASLFANIARDFLGMEIDFRDPQWPFIMAEETGNGHLLQNLNQQYTPKRAKSVPKVAPEPAKEMPEKPIPLPPEAPEYRYAAWKYLTRERKLGATMANYLLGIGPSGEQSPYRICYPAKRKGANGKASPCLIVPFCGLETGMPVAVNMIDLASGFKGNLGHVTQGVLLIGSFGPQTRQIVATEGFIDAASQWLLRGYGSDTCVIATGGTRTPDKIIKFCKDHGARIVAAFDNDAAGFHSYRNKWEKACREEGVEFVDDMPPGGILQVEIDSRCGNTSERIKWIASRLGKNHVPYSICQKDKKAWVWMENCDYVRDKVLPGVRKAFVATDRQKASEAVKNSGKKFASDYQRENWINSRTYTHLKFLMKDPNDNVQFIRNRKHLVKGAPTYRAIPGLPDEFIDFPSPANAVFGVGETYHRLNLPEEPTAAERRLKEDQIEIPADWPDEKSALARALLFESREPQQIAEIGVLAEVLSENLQKLSPEKASHLLGHPVKGLGGETMPLARLVTLTGNAEPSLLERMERKPKGPEMSQSETASEITIAI